MLIFSLFVAFAPDRDIEREFELSRKAKTATDRAAKAVKKVRPGGQVHCRPKSSFPNKASLMLNILSYYLSLIHI